MTGEQETPPGPKTGRGWYAGTPWESWPWELAHWQDGAGCPRLEGCGKVVTRLRLCVH